MKFSKRITAVLLAVLLTVSMGTVAAFANAVNAKRTDYSLKFDDNGKFRILQIADLEENQAVDNYTLLLIKTAVQRYKPNLILLTGDNTTNTVAAAGFKQTMTSLTSAFGSVPFAATFGELDAANSFSLKRQNQYDSLISDYGALDYDNNFSNVDLPGVGTGCIPILTADGTKVAYNIVMFDTGAGNDDGGYAKPGYNPEKPYTNEEGYKSVVNWFKTMNESMCEYTVDGKYAPTLAFQHNALHEIYGTGVLDVCNKTEEGAVAAGEKTGYTGYYKLSKNNASITGEYTSPAICSTGSTVELYTALAENRNVKGIFYGNEHKNTFIGKTTYVDELNNKYSLVQGCCPAANRTTGIKGVPAIRLFELYDDGEYITNVVSYTSIMNDIANDKCYYINNDPTKTYISEIATGCDSKADVAKAQLVYGGYTVIDVDLNNGASGKYVYMGYKTTNDPSKAITAIRFLVGDQNTVTFDMFKSKVNGIECSFKKVFNGFTKTTQDDFNSGAGGNYIYAYATRDKCAGGITSIKIDFVASHANYTEATSFFDLNTPTDLNKGAGGMAIYLHYQTSTDPVQFEHDNLQKLVDDTVNFLDTPDPKFSESSVNALRESLTNAQAILASYVQNTINSEYGPAQIFAAMKEIRAARNALGVSVTFELNGGDMDVANVDVSLGDEDSAELDLSQYVPTSAEGLTFLGWSTDNTQESIVNGSIMISENTTLYAMWSHETLESDSEASDPDTEGNTPSDTEQPSNLYGDVNCDGKITMEDVTSLQKIIASLTTYESYGAMSKTNADCDGNGQGTMVDVTLIQKYLALLIPSLEPAAG